MDSASRCSATYVFMELRTPDVPEEVFREGGVGQRLVMLLTGRKRVRGREQVGKTEVAMLVALQQLKGKWRGNGEVKWW